MRRAATIVVLALLMMTTSFAGRAEADTIDGLFDEVGAIQGGSTLNLTVVGRGGVPSDGVGSVALNVTVTNPTATGFLTVWPAGAERPLASNVNYGPFQTVPNMVIVPVGVGGQVSIFASAGSVDVIVDVLGWFPTGIGFNGLLPARLIDTRSGAATVDGAFAGTGPVAGGTSIDFGILGRGGVPGTGVGSVALNVTVTNPTAAGFLTVWPTGSPRPLASNLNFVPGQTVPNMVIVPVGTGGHVSIFGSAGTVDAIADVLGWFPADTGFTGLTPARLADTRFGEMTVDNAYAGLGFLTGGATLDLTVVGRGGVPSSAVGSVALNVTAANPTAAGFLTVWPTGSPRPLASNLNFVPGRTVPNMVIVPVGTAGQISIYASAGTLDAIVDVLGYFPTGPGFNGLTPARLMDTRVPAPPTPPLALTFGNGTYLVNTTLPPGRYLAANGRRGCYWERLNGLGGTLNEIIANDLTGYNGRVIVDISPSDLAFHFDSSCGQFKTYTATNSPATTIVPGAHVVGDDIAAGTYTTNAASGCYWQRTSSFDGQLKSIIANDFLGSTQTAIVTISPTDTGFTTDADCGTWTLTG